jgi:hypothetical protein
MATRATVLFDQDATDPFARVRAARIENFRLVAPFFWTSIIFCLLVFAKILTLPTPWYSVATLGLLLTPLLLETSCYYTVWLALIVPLRKDHVAFALLPLSTVAALLTVDDVVRDLDLRYASHSMLLVAMVIALLIIVVTSRPMPKKDLA